MSETSPDKRKIVAIMGARVAAGSSARVAVPAAVVAALGVAFLAAPPMGTDLAAQTARAGFFAAYGWAALDFGWYGGVSPHGYSLLSPPLMAWLGGGTAGPRVLGALAALASTAALSLLLARTGATRPVLGGVLGAGCFFGNLASGRVTYALGVALGLLALLAVTSRRRWLRTGGALGGAALATLASPVAGLFVGLAGAALTLARVLSRRRVRPSDAPDDGSAVDRASWRSGGLALMAGAAVPIVAMAALFGAGGWMNISAWDTARAAVAGLVVAALVPRPAARIGALLSTLGVLTAYAVHTPVGLNATRLAAMFALPVLAGYARAPGWLLDALRPRLPAAPFGRQRWASGLALSAVLVAVAVWQPPVSVADLRAAGDPAARPEYFASLNAELRRRAPIGRVEVVPFANYWDAAYVPPTVPLARGWLRQADLAHNGLFFTGRLTADEYHRWLRHNGVGYVAVAAAAPSWVGRAEAAVIRSDPPYLTRVWRDARWTLYAVAGASSIVEGGTLVRSSAGGVTLDARPGEVLVRVRWSRWLAVGGGDACLARRGDWTVLRVKRPGRYELTGALLDRGPFCG